MKSISCIIPAYNEATRIGEVIDAVLGHPLVSEIVVVDDGSTDGTKDIIAAYTEVHLIVLPENRGKSGAVAEGIRRASGELLLLLDADLAGLSSGDITRLIEPVSSGAADISISLRRNAPWQWRFLGLDFISGERVFPREFIEPMLEELSSFYGFGLEVFMNKSILRHRLRIAVVRWEDVHSAFKHHVSGTLRLFGVNEDYIRMTRHVLHVISPLQALRQIVGMRRLLI